MKTVLQLEGLDCASCAAELERQIAAIEGVTFVTIAFVTQKLTVEYETQATLEKVVDTANRFEEVRVLDAPERTGAGMRPTKKVRDKKRFLEWLRIAISALFFVGGFLLEKLTESKFALVCYAVSYFVVGYPVLISTAKNIARGKIFDENFLMTVASIGAFLLGETGEAVLVTFLYQIGETLQAIAVDGSRRSVTQLMDLKVERATLFKGKEQLEITPEQIAVGDILLVKAGEKVPVDGVLIGANATLDTSSLTGEPLPKRVKMNEKLLSGCINSGGSFVMRATHTYENSAVKRILDLVENASSVKAKPEKFITKFARWYTPLVCGLAIVVALLAPPINALIVDGTAHYHYFARWAKSALTFLVVSCPCALIISVPLTYFSGIGACAKAGVLVKGATYLDIVARANCIAFDKTGTLTEGNFTVCLIKSESGVTETELLALATAAEKRSAHPIAKAFTHIATPYTAESVTEKAGRGLTAMIDGKKVLVGNAEHLCENGVCITPVKSVYTTVYVAREGEYLGCIEIGDKLRAETKETISTLKSLGFKRLVMLTGDGEARAQAIANEVGMYEVNASLLPDEKLQCAEALKKDGTLIYIGDGINDAPVMAAADCAVSMGKLGSAAAVEASDLVLISDNLKALPACIKTARKTRKIVLQNILFSIAMKVAFMALGAVGILPLWLAVFADVGVMLLAVLNSLRVRKN